MIATGIKYEWLSGDKGVCKVDLYIKLQNSIVNWMCTFYATSSAEKKQVLVKCSRYKCKYPKRYHFTKTCFIVINTYIFPSVINYPGDVSAHARQM